MRIFPSVFALAAVSAVFAQSKPIAIINVRIEVGDGKVIPSGTVVIKDGKISGVSEAAELSNADVIDAKGKVLYPGFIDAYSTRGLKLPDAPAASTAPDSRTTAPASMWHANRKGIRMDAVAAKCLDIKDQLDANYSQGITSALLSPGMGTIRGIASIVNYTETGDVIFPSAAGEIAIRGGGFGGGGGGAAGTEPAYPGSLLGIIALARQTLIDAQAYAANPPEKKDEGFENLKPLALKQIPVLFAADNEREIVRCGNLAQEFGLRAFYGGAHDAYKQVSMLKASQSAVLASVDLGAEPSTKVAEGPDATPQAVLDERHQTWVDRSQNIKQLLDAGVPVAFSSFGGNLSDYLKNVRKVISSGVSRDAVLKCMTSGSATILGVGDRIGTIEVGKQANLVLMSGDFADDKSEVETVFVEGKRIDVKKGAGK